MAVDPDSGATRVALDDVFAPSAVKFDHNGHVVVTEAGSGYVTVADLTTGERRVLTQLPPGLDNLAFAGASTLYVSSFVTAAIYRIGLDDGAVEVMSTPSLITANGLSQSSDGTLLVSDRLSVVAVDRHGSLRRLACVPVDMQFAVAGAVMVGETLCVVTTEGKLLQRRQGEQAFRALPVSDAVDVATGIAVLGQLLLVGCGSDVLAIDRSGAVQRSIATGLRVTALAAFEESIVVCERGTGTVALFDSGSATVWTDFVDPRPSPFRRTRCSWPRKHRGGSCASPAPPANGWSWPGSYPSGRPSPTTPTAWARRRCARPPTARSSWVARATPACAGCRRYSRDRGWPT